MLLWAWEQIRYKVFNKIPRWIKPLEIGTKPEWIRKDQNVIYAELLNEKDDILREKPLEDKQIVLDWWSELRIRFRIEEDKNTILRERNRI